MEGLHFDGICFKNKAPNIHDSWCKDNDDYDPLIAGFMYHWRWCDLRRNMKLNNNSQCLVRGQPGHDPSAKYRFVWDVMTGNLNSYVKEASNDFTVDECTLGSMSFLAAGKKRVAPFTQEGPWEIKELIDVVDLLICGHLLSPDNKRRLLWPILTFDNHFSGCHVTEYMGTWGYRATCTTQRDCLPKDIFKKYFHHKKLQMVSKESKVARFATPIVAVKYVPGKPGSNKTPYLRAHVSFQSTGATNISSVDALEEVSLNVMLKSWGRREQHKRN
ncbi:hypothetical protein ACHAWF_000996 [Thalassiosira exigua]